MISTFGGWSGDSGDCNDNRNCNLTIDSNKSVTATFNLAPKAMIGTNEYGSLNAAYLAAYNSVDASSVIYLLNAELTEDLEIIGKNISLIGGYSADYKSRSGLPSVLKGKLTIRSGSLRVDSVNVR